MFLRHSSTATGAGCARSRVFLLAYSLLIVSSAGDAETRLTPSEQAGRRIYREGIGVNSVRAFVAGSVEALGSAYPCIVCHGDEGKGGREGGIQTADIRPATLAAPRPASGATTLRAAYTEQALANAISRGVDASENTLHTLMPRYSLTNGDMQNLLAYLKRLGSEPVAGVSEDAIRVGILLPVRGTLAAAAEEIWSLLNAYFAQVNEKGGIYGRKLRLETWQYDADRVAASATVLRERAAKAPPFCFLANLTLNLTSEPFAFLSADDAASLAPLALPGPPNAVEKTNVFYVYTGPYHQARVLVDYLVDDAKLGQDPVALLHADDAHGCAAATGAREQAKLRNLQFAFESVASSSAAKNLAATLKQRHITKVTYFGPQAVLEALTRAARELNWPMAVFGSAELLGTGATELPADAVTELTLVSAVGITDPRDDQLVAFQTLAESAKLPRAPSALQMTAFAGARLLEETLKQTGRGVTRDSFLRQLKATRGMRTGVSPALTYGETRRSGSQSAMILKLDPRTRRLAAVTDFREPK